MKTRRITIAASSLLGLALLGTTLHAPATLSPSLMLDGAAVAGAPVYFSGNGFPSSSARIVVVSGPFSADGMSPAKLDVAGAVPTEHIGVVVCYNGSPSALGTADVTTDSSGNIGDTLVWAAAVPGSYTALLLQGTCSAGVKSGLSPQAVSDARIVASRDFTVGDAHTVPALSAWGFAALGLALSVAGWGFLRTRS